MLIYIVYWSVVLKVSPSCRNDPYLSRVPVSVINSWYQREGYIKSMADLISKELESFSEPAQVLLISGVAILMQLNLRVWSDNILFVGIGTR